nr:lytic transglycosylase domain-containing protein [Pseudotabrizicola algicola]
MPAGAAQLCDVAAADAAAKTGVPLDILLAISRVESGRNVGGVLSPWPWTVNQAGDGAFFDSLGDATDHVLRALADGQRNIDIGCFQINIRWHAAEFTSLEAMFDPDQNAHYAARFLLKLFDEFGSWDAAIGAYHSRQSGAATSYQAKVSALLATVPQTPRAASFSDDQPARSALRSNRYPLLRPVGAGGLGSLVASAQDRPAVPLFR